MRATTKRIMAVTAGAALATLIVLPAASAGADPGVVIIPHSITTPPTVNGIQTPVVGADSTTITPPDVVGSSTTPKVAATDSTVTPTASTTSLPFTGADIEELAVVGVGAVLAGGLLLRRRRARA
jgi:LPXTG-motif cell wall-anchored protein